MKDYVILITEVPPSSKLRESRDQKQMMQGEGFAHTLEHQEAGSVGNHPRSCLAKAGIEITHILFTCQTP